MEKGSVTRIKDAPLCDKNGYPRLVDSIEKCCGCAACCAICPKNAIRMDADEEGFFILLLTLRDVYNATVA